MACTCGSHIDTRGYTGRLAAQYTSCGEEYQSCCPGGCNVEKANNNIVTKNLDMNTSTSKSVNLSYSTSEMIFRKKEIITKRINKIKDLAYWPISSNYALYYEGQLVQLFQPIGKKEINLLLLKMANWKISSLEKTNLYYNLISQNKTSQNLNLLRFIKERLIQHKLSNLDNSVIKDYINRYLSQIISRILIYAEFGKELDNYDYTQLFNLGCEYINLNLNLIKYFLYTYMSGFILKHYGIDTRKVKQNPEITNSENSQEKGKCSKCH